jgi:hypothetical protein
MSGSRRKMSITPLSNVEPSCNAFIVLVMSVSSQVFASNGFKVSIRTGVALNGTNSGIGSA